AVRAWKEFVRNGLPKVLESTLTEAVNIWRKAKSPIEMTNVIERLHGLERMLEGSIESPAAFRHLDRLREAVGYLTEFKNLLAGEESGDIELIFRASTAMAE